MKETIYVAVESTKENIEDSNCRYFTDSNGQSILIKPLEVSEGLTLTESESNYVHNVLSNGTIYVEQLLIAKHTAILHERDERIRELEGKLDDLKSTDDHFNEIGELGICSRCEEKRRVGEENLCDDCYEDIHGM